jgi:hypothetical protein
MHLLAFLSVLAVLAASVALCSPIGPNGEGLCLKDCVGAAIRPFVAEAAREGFRQSLGALNTLETCAASVDCRDTVHIFTEEIVDMVFKDRVDRRNGLLASTDKDGYAGEHCGPECLITTVRTAAAQAGVVAMAVGQKHYYGNDSFWNRWSPRQILELDQAMRQLKGRNMAELAYVAGSGDKMNIDRTSSIRKFDLPGFRYNGSAEIPLLYRPFTPDTRTMVRKVLSYVPGWGVDAGVASRDTKLLTKRGYADGWLNGEGTPNKNDLPSMDLAHCPLFAKFNNATRDLIQEAYDTIQRSTATNKLDGFAYFLYHQRLYQSTNSTEDNAPTKLDESWYRMLAEMDYAVDYSANRAEDDEDWFQAGNWVWQIRAFGVANGFTAHPNTTGWQGPQSDGTRNRIYDAMNTRHPSRLTQWLTDSLNEPLPGVQKPGYTHQPWTNPWFFEYTSNASLPTQVDLDYSEAQEYLAGMAAEDNNTVLAIRGYSYEFRMMNKAFKEGPEYFLDHAFNASTGGINDFEMIQPYSRFDDGWAYVNAITGDGRVFPRMLSPHYAMFDGKRYFDILDQCERPVYTEQGKPVQLVYDDETGLAETRYGRALWNLEWTMQKGGL